MNLSSNGTLLDGLSNLGASTTAANATSGGIVPDEILYILTVMNFAIICAFLFVFGSITNIINIIVFGKIGFKDPVNISLFVLAISDFGCCFSLLLFALCFNPFFQKLDLPFDPKDFHYFSGWVHIAFSRITSLTTAFITFERCLCVAAPLKVKDIITPKRVTIFLSVTVVLVSACFAPHFYTAKHVWEFKPERNKSILILVFSENSDIIDNNTFAVHSIFLPVLAFFVVVVSTALLVYNLKQKSKWRENATKSSNALSARDAKVSKMVVTIATLFIVCFIPVLFSFATWLTVPQFRLKGQYNNLFVIMFSFHFALEATNSSLNIFIYYRMSSNYRSVFYQLFGMNKTKKDRQ